MKKQLTTSKKINTLKNQALTNLICGVISVPLYSLMLLPDSPLNKDVGTGFVLIAVIVLVALIIRSAGKKESPDELSAANMQKADSVIAAVDPFIIIAVGLFIQMRSNYLGIESFSIRGETIMFFALLLMSINLIVKNAVFLWLDRTPKMEEEE